MESNDTMADFIARAKAFNRWLDEMAAKLRGLRKPTESETIESLKKAFGMN